MKAAKRWMVLVAACALMYVLLLGIARVFDVDPLVWIAQKINRAADERREAEREAARRERHARLEKEMAEATRGVPYRMDWPFGSLSRQGSEFQIAVKGDQVGFYQRIPGVTPPPDVWFIYLTIEYNDTPDPQVRVDTAWRLRIDQSHIEPFRIVRAEHAYQDELLLPSVTYPGGEVVRFHCLFAGAPDGFRDATSPAELARIDPRLNISCRTFLGIRWGIRMMVQFPINKADVAHRGVTQAIALMDRSILDRAPPVN